MNITCTQESSSKIEILLVGGTITAIELCKHLLDRGNFALTILDDAVLQKEEINYMTDPSLIGKKRVHVYLPVLKRSRKDVNIKVEEVSVLEMPISFYKQFTLVVATIENVDLVIFLDELCREHNMKFFYAAVCGRFGFILHEIPCIFHLTTYTYVLRKEKKFETSVYHLYTLFKMVHNFMVEHNRKPNIAEHNDDLLKLMKCFQDSYVNIQPPVGQLPFEYLDFKIKEFVPTCILVAEELSRHIEKCLVSPKNLVGGITLFSPINESVSFISAKDLEEAVNIDNVLKLAEECLAK